MPVSKPKRRDTCNTLQVADALRNLLSQWVRTTRDQAGTPSTARMETLRLLQDDGPLAIAALAQLRAVKHQSMRLVVEELAAQGSVQKEVDPCDRRSQLVSITNQGRLVIQQDQRSRSEWIGTLLAGCTAEEQNQIAGAMTVLEKLLEKAK